MHFEGWGVLLLVLLALAAVASRFWSSPLSPPSPPPPAPPPWLYGFVAAGFSDPNLPALVASYMRTYSVKDVQFYDWFPNYSGVYQAFPATSAKSPKPLPGWWTGDAPWTDPFFRSRAIDPKLLREAIKAVQAAGGRAWAYVQSQASEYAELAGAGPPPCGGQRGAKDASCVATVAALQKACPLCCSVDLSAATACPELFGGGAEPLCRLYGADGKRFCASSDGAFRAPLAAFANDAALARYQCSAWIPPVKAFGFDGVHWDVMAVPGGGAAPHGGLAFLTAAKPLLQQADLLQTFNDVSLDFQVSSERVFGPDGLLLFPYTEVWSDSEAERAMAARAPDAVVAAYPGSARYGCPPALASSPSCCAQWSQPPCLDTAALAVQRCERFHASAMRYCIVGIGVDGATPDNAKVGMLVNEYFPFVAEVPPELKSCLSKRAPPSDALPAPSR